jgi:chromosome segregation ATPase
MPLMLLEGVDMPDAQESTKERLAEQREDMRELRADIKQLDGRVDADALALAKLSGDVALLTAAVAAMGHQQTELLGECRQLRSTLEGLRVEVAKAGEMASNPIAAISARAKTAGGIGGGGIVFGIIYAYGKSKGWWE